MQIVCERRAEVLYVKNFSFSSRRYQSVRQPGHGITVRKSSLVVGLSLTQNKAQGKDGSLP
jgi:hypothetical protein